MEISRQLHARRHGVTTQAIDKAVKVGTVSLHQDGSVNVEASDAIWAHRRAMRRSADDAESQRPVDLAAQLALLARDQL